MQERITVIGIGRLGLSFALCLEQAGFDVLGIDVSPDYVSQINTKTLRSLEPGIVDSLKVSKRLKASTSLKAGLDHANFCFIIVPTNTIAEIQSYDHTIVSGLLSEINSYKVSNKNIVISSTIFPGYIKKTARPLLKDCKNTTLSYNPEFIAQGSIMKGLKAPDMVLIGEGSQEAGDFLENLYLKTCTNTPSIQRMSVESAEITKLAVNCFITAKIAFANLIGDMADETTGAKKEDVLTAIGKDSRIGFKNLAPGYGFGGPCFPRDNKALGNYASLLGINPILLRATDQTNNEHASFMAQKLFDRHLKEYLFEDVCYKPQSPVPIIERSQKLEVARELALKGKKVVIQDAEHVIVLVRKEYGAIFEYRIYV